MRYIGLPHLDRVSKKKCQKNVEYPSFAVYLFRDSRERKDAWRCVPLRLFEEEWRTPRGFRNSYPCPRRGYHHQNCRCRQADRHIYKHRTTTEKRVSDKIDIAEITLFMEFSGIKSQCPENFYFAKSGIICIFASSFNRQKDREKARFLYSA